MMAPENTQLDPLRRMYCFAATGSISGEIFPIFFLSMRTPAPLGPNINNRGRGMRIGDVTLTRNTAFYSPSRKSHDNEIRHLAGCETAWRAAKILQPRHHKHCTFEYEPVRMARRLSRYRSRSSANRVSTRSKVWPLVFDRLSNLARTEAPRSLISLGIGGQSLQIRAHDGGDTAKFSMSGDFAWCCFAAA